MIPARAIMLIIEVAVNCAPANAWPGSTPMMVNGISDAHVAKRLVRDLPLTVPLDAVVVWVVGLVHKVLLKWLVILRIFLNLADVSAVLQHIPEVALSLENRVG